MSADLLREAAALMRERAEAASPAPWRVTEESGRDYTDEAWFNTDVTASDGKSAAWYCDEQEGVQNAEHIASWHPAVALAVADWLEVVANRADEVADSLPSGTARVEFICRSTVTGYVEATATARAYLGRSA